jgi:oligoribonuclease
MSKFPILDFETTGLVIDPGAILEVSVSVMDTEGTTIEEYTSAVDWTPSKIDSLLNDWARKTHTESGLLDQCYSYQPYNNKKLKVIEQDLIDLFSKHFPGQKVVLVGNSIHFDRKWIERYMPEFNKILHYRMLDVSALWEYMDLFHDIKRPDNGPVSHRGIPDTRGSAKLLKQFGQYVRGYY